MNLPGSSVHGILGQEYWSGQPFLSPGMEPGFLTLQADSLPAESPGKPESVLRGSRKLYAQSREEPGRKHTEASPTCVNTEFVTPFQPAHS